MPELSIISVPDSELRRANEIDPLNLYQGDLFTDKVIHAILRDECLKTTHYFVYQRIL